MNLFWFFVLFPLLLLLIIMVAILSVRWERRFRARQEQNAPAGFAAVQGTVTALQSKLQEWQSQLPALDRIKTLPSGLLPQPLPEDLPARFLTWADTAFAGDPALQQWLRQLPEQGQQIITQRLAAFCTDIGFELLWLLDHQLDLDQAVQHGAQTVVQNYCRACYEAVPIFADLQLLRPYLALRAAPTHRAHRPFGQQLYIQLVAAGLATPLPADIALAAEAVRWDYVSQAIAQAATADPHAVCTLVKQIAQADANPPVTATPPPPDAFAASPAAEPAPSA